MNLISDRNANSNTLIQSSDKHAYNRGVDSNLVERLLALNRAFYAQFSGAFSDTRSGARMNLEPLQKYLAHDIRLLDAGCGNGRLAEALERAGYLLDYLGVDASAELVAHAEKKYAALENVRAHFRVLDLTAPRWGETLRAVAPFDIIISLAVLHHLPSFELRANVLKEICALLKPRGTFIMSNWQFLNNERLRKKIVPWEKIETEDWGLETGDYLLDWKRGGVGYRYVHLLDENEIERLADASGLRVLEQFLADADLNLYSMMERV